MSYNFIGLFLIVTNFFCNIIIKLQECYMTYLLGQNNVCFANEYVSHRFLLNHTDENTYRLSFCKSNHNKFISLEVFTC